jgi:hypothetical protein
MECVRLIGRLFYILIVLDFNSCSPSCIKVFVLYITLDIFVVFYGQESGRTYFCTVV